jgi:hypothetical protein
MVDWEEGSCSTGPLGTPDISESGLGTKRLVSNSAKTATLCKRRDMLTVRCSHQQGLIPKQFCVKMIRHTELEDTLVFLPRIRELT